jgi:PqqD family protein of HPr-rel-A system
MLEQAPQTTVETTSEATSCEVGDETVILDLGSGQYFALDAVGTAIWRHLRTPCTFAALCERLQAEYDVPPARCQSDVSTLLEDLARRGLVRLRA